ncbi:MAG: ABC transporter substrate-binding protein [Pseudomonadota bacterium]
MSTKARFHAPLTRRAALGGLAAGLAATLPPGRALALESAEAETLISALVDELTTLVTSGLDDQQQKTRFRALFERYAAVPQITRFVMGAPWRDMSDAQKARFQESLLNYVASTYVDLLLDYEGQSIEVSGSLDFGARGIVVTSIANGPNVEGREVEWLVSDRGGDGPKLVDITALGISLLQTQRQEFAAMLEKTNGDVDAFIDDLDKIGGA